MSVRTYFLRERAISRGIRIARLFFRRKSSFGAQVNEEEVLCMFLDKAALWYDVRSPVAYSLLIALRVEKHVVITVREYTWERLIPKQQQF